MSDFPADIVISRHAVRRYRQRRCRVPAPTAEERITRCLQTGTVMSRPPDYFGIAANNNVKYCYSSADPDLCLVLSGGCVVTVYTTRSCRRWAIDAVEGRRQRPVSRRGSRTRRRRR